MAVRSCANALKGKRIRLVMKVQRVKNLIRVPLGGVIKFLVNTVVADETNRATCDAASGNRSRKKP
jgi:hypothetical protein